MRTSSLNIAVAQPQSDLLYDNLAWDALGLFLQERTGHMGQWEYNRANFLGDPAGGAGLWAKAIACPGDYYLAQGERDLISTFIREHMPPSLSKTKTVVEFGVGSDNAILNKTIPFITSCSQATRYIAIDCSSEQADDACRMIRQNLNIRATPIYADFAQGQFRRTWEGPATYVMWGCTIGNLPGHAGENPHDALVKELRLLQKTLLKGDSLILIFDTNDDETSIRRSYNEPALKRQSLSWLYGLQRDGLVAGNFDPQVWRHDPVWYPDVMQCAHTLFPVIDQTIIIGDQTIQIPAWTRFVSNNSYKFRPDAMRAAAAQAGLQSQVVQHGPMAMLIAEK